MNYIYIIIPISIIPLCILIIYPKIIALLLWKCMMFYTDIKFKINNLNRKLLKNSHSFFTAIDNYKTYYYIPKDSIKNLIVDYKFLSVVYNDSVKKLEISICNNPNNEFMLINNYILDFNFVKWYLDTFHHYKINPEYTLEIIDDFAEVLNINQTQGIHIQKDKYLICNQEDVS